MMQLRWLLFFLLILSTPMVRAASNHWGRLAPDDVAYFIQNTATGAVLAEHRANALMHPASVMKLVTAFAAFEMLGADYRWHTQWTTDGVINHGILQGNLFWPGSGDPMFDQDDVVAMQQQLRDVGIKEIQGKVIMDRRLWQNIGTAVGYQDQGQKSYTTTPDPHMIAYRVAWVEAYRDAQGRLRLQTKPPLPAAQIYQKWHPSRAKTCTRLANHLKVSWHHNKLYIRGQLPQSCEGRSLYIPMPDAYAFARLSFQNQWWQWGGKQTFTFQQGRAPENGRIVAEHTSPPLSTIIWQMNKHSNNLIARTLFLTMGDHQLGQHFATLTDISQRADAAIRQVFERYGIETSALKLENGSGLSQRERVTARFIAQLLQQAWQASYRDFFIASLPEAGIDGTLKRRLSDIAGLHLKTGSLNHVTALAGYRIDPHNPEQNLTIVVLVNRKHNQSAHSEDIDQLLRSLLVQVKNVYHETPKKMAQVN